MTNLEMLLSRLEHLPAGGGDRNLDGDLAAAFGLVPPESQGDGNIRRYLPTEHGKAVWLEWNAPNLTSSVDDALAAPQSWPRLQWVTVRWDAAGESTATICGNGPGYHYGRGSDPARAIIAAYLRAMIAEAKP